MLQEKEELVYSKRMGIKKTKHGLENKNFKGKIDINAQKLLQSSRNLCNMRLRSPTILKEEEGAGEEE